MDDFVETFKSNSFKEDCHGTLDILIRTFFEKQANYSKGEFHIDDIEITITLKIEKTIIN